MKIKKLSLSLIILLLSCCLGWGQEIFEIDTISNQIKGELPFDRSFVLKIKDKDKSIEKIFVYELYVVNGNIAFAKKNIFGKIVQGKMLFNPNFHRSKDYVFVHMQPLNPGLQIELRLIHKFRGKPLQELIGVFALLHAGKPGDAKKQMSTLINKLERQIGGIDFTAYGGSGWGAKRWDELQKFFTNNLKPQFDAIDNHTYAVTLDKLTETDLGTLDVRALALKLDTKPLQKLWNLLNNNLFMNIQKGYISTEDTPTTKKAEFFDLSKRIANLKKSGTFVNLAKITIENIALRDSKHTLISSGIISQLRTLEYQLYENQELLSEQLKQITKKIDNEKNLRYTTWFSGDNEVYNLKTAGSYQIIPEIGIASIFAKGNSTNKTYVSPYVGASIYLRPVDKNIPYKQLKHTFLHRFSINLGLTVSSIKDDKEFSDLFNGMSLLTGLNYKVTRALAISSGAVWLKQVDKNPLIDETTVVPRLYVSLALDVDVVNTINKLTGKLSL